MGHGRMMEWDIYRLASLEKHSKEVTVIATLYMQYIHCSV